MKAMLMFETELNEWTLLLTLKHTPPQGIDMGPIVHESQRKSIDEFIQKAKLEGAEVYQACACMPPGGLYYPPTLITKVQPVSICVQEEVRKKIFFFCWISCYKNF